MSSADQERTRKQSAAARPCSFCRQTAAHEVLRPQVFGHGERLLVIENVPTMVCDNCGEAYFTGQTLAGLEHILKQRTELATLRSVPVAQYTRSAA